MRNHHQKAQKHTTKNEQKNTKKISRLRAKNKSRRQNKKANSHGPAGAIKRGKIPLCTSLQRDVRARHMLNIRRRRRIRVCKIGVLGCARASPARATRSRVRAATWTQPGPARTRHAISSNARPRAFAGGNNDARRPRPTTDGAREARGSSARPRARRRVATAGRATLVVVAFAREHGRSRPRERAPNDAASVAVDTGAGSPPRRARGARWRRRAEPPRRPAAGSRPVLTISPRAAGSLLPVL